MSTKNSASSRAAAVANRSLKTEYVQVDNPPSAENFETAFKKATGQKTGLANQFVVNVLPNFVPILLYIIYHVQQNIKNLEPKDHAKVSAATFTAYCLTIVYAHFLVSDAFIRPTPSHYAEDLKNSNVHREYIDFLLGLPVPNFLVPVLNYFTTTTSPRRSNVWFAACAAGFNHFTHFGRFFPINMFTMMHDLAADTNPRTDPTDVEIELNQSTIFTITRLNNAVTNAQIKFHHFFASMIPSFGTVANANNMRLANKVNQVMKSLFNPILLRSMQQKQAFTEIALTPPTFPNANYNPYIAMLAMSKQNIPELRTFLDSIASVMNGTVPCTSDLAGIYTTYSGVSILNHGYSRFALPTWDMNTSTTPATNKKFKPLDDAAFAAALRFKASPTRADFTARTFARPTARVTQIPPTATSTATVVIASEAAQLITTTPGPTTDAELAPGPSHFLLYDSEHDLYPKIKLLNPFEEDTASAWMTTLCGMIIETEDLSGSAVPHPHPSSRIEEDNAIFLGSAIPYRNTYLATSFSTSNPTPTFASKTSAPSYTAPAAVTLLRDMTTNALPYLTATYYSRGTNFLHYGIHRLQNISLPEFVQTSLNYTIRNKTTVTKSDEDHVPIRTNDHALLVWSPYTFVSAAYDDEWTHADIRSPMENLHFITNLRTIFGTDPTLIEVNHPLYAMPVA